MRKLFRILYCRGIILFCLLLHSNQLHGSLISRLLRWYALSSKGKVGGLLFSALVYSLLNIRYFSLRIIVHHFVVRLVF